MEVTIEICSNCKEHAWCTRHNEATYLSLAEELAKAIRSHRQNASISILKVGGNKMGSFEVTCNGYLLFSKLALGYFPHTILLTNRLLQFIDDAEHGRDLHKYKGGLSPIKYNPNVKHSSSQSPERNNSANIPHEEKPKEESKTIIKEKAENIVKPSKIEVPKKETPKKEENPKKEIPIVKEKEHKPHENQHHGKQKKLQQAEPAKQAKQLKQEEKKHTQEKQPSHKEQPHVKVNTKGSEHHESKPEKAVEPHHEAKIQAKHEGNLHLQTPKKQQVHKEQVKHVEHKQEVAHKKTEHHHTEHKEAAQEPPKETQKKREHQAPVEVHPIPHEKTVHTEPKQNHQHLTPPAKAQADKEHHKQGQKQEPVAIQPVPQKEAEPENASTPLAEVVAPPGTNVQ